ncbi:hypothetical protein [uncultured Chryseobacterium sp.]|uniref:hypothetical protein n=1 Tax=uncultured Chryseobacterium sp. TaxID=259322 RepID=UPI0025F62278|nr:hypothetical protein [uncultured Chryseobacterium sp.]
MIETKPFKFLSEENQKYLRIIRLQGKEYNKYISFIFYLRDIEFQELDNLDNSFLESLNQNQIAAFELNTKIIFENQLDEIINRYKLDDTKRFTLQLNPIITNELIEQMQLGREVYGYIKYFKISFSKGDNFMYFHDYYLSYLDIDELEKLQDTIQGK